ncbi:MAG: SDR family oxidoreductase [Pseudomonadota bacterium]
MHVLITGANRGIGLALSQSYDEQGVDVTGTSRAASSEFQLDVTDAASAIALAHKLDGKPIDLLVCNAGVYLDKSEKLADGFPAEMWERTFAANVTGVFLTVQALLPNLQAAENGKVAILSSQMASQTRAPGGSYIYRASKAAALNLGRNLATDLEPLGIAVGIYHPGWVRTDMGGDAASISVDDAAEGLIARFSELSIHTTGAFLTWDGAEHPF